MYQSKGRGYNMEFHISLIRDINAVMFFSDDAVVHVIDGNILVSHQFRGHNIVTWFKGDGVMHIYESDSADIENLKALEHVLYDTHWSIGGDPSMGYWNAVKAFVGE